MYSVKKTCVHVRRVSKTYQGRKVIVATKNIIQGAALTTLSDVTIHHAPLNYQEISHVTVDATTIAAFAELAKYLMRLI